MNFLTSLFKSGGNIDDLCAAMAKGDLDRVKAMLKRNPKLVRAKNDKGMTPLHIAVQLNRLEIAAVLIELGADVNASSDKGITPLQCASAGGNKKLVDFLQKHGGKK